MPSPASSNELASALQDAQELARQRELALELRDERIRYRLKRDLLARRQRSRRAVDLLGLADAIAYSRTKQQDYILQPQEAETAGALTEGTVAKETTQS